MPYLELFKSGRKQREVPVEGVQVVIGRGADADVRLDAVAVSRRHAVLRADGGQWVIEDLQTRNGTFVNGTREYSCVVQDGDRIQIDEYVLAFHRPPGELVPDAPSKFSSKKDLARANARAKGVRWEPQTEDNQSIPQRPAEGTRVVDTRDAARKRRDAQLRLGPHLVEHGERDLVHALRGARTLIGSDKRDCDIQIPGAPLIGTAVVRRRDDGVFFVRWRGIFGSILVNGVKRRQSVLHGDEEIVIHGVLFTFHGGES